MGADKAIPGSRGREMLLRRRSRSRAPAASPAEGVTAEIRPDTSKIADQPKVPALCVRIPIASQMLGIGRTKIYELINAGELETIKLGEAVLITTKSLEAFVVRHARTQGKPDPQQ